MVMTVTSIIMIIRATRRIIVNKEKDIRRKNSILCCLERFIQIGPIMFSMLLKTLEAFVESLLRTYDLMNVKIIFFSDRRCLPANGNGFIKICNESFA